MRTPVTLLFAALGCLAQDAQKACVVVPPKEPHIQIDANSMQVVHGSLVYSNMTEVPVLVVNKNPFKYNYQFTWTSQVIEAAPIEDFLLRLGIPLVAPAATVASAPALVPQAATACPLDLVKKVTALESQVKGVRALLTAKLDLAKEVNAFIDRVSGVDLAGECISVYNNAKELRPKIATLASVTEVEQKQTEAQAEFDDLLAKVLADSGCSMSPAIIKVFDALKLELDDLKADTAEWKETMGSKENVATRKALVSRIDSALQNSKSFWGFEMTLPRPDEPTTYTISPARQEMFPKSGPLNTSSQKILVRIGRSRFSLSGGVGITTLGQKTIGRVPDKSDATKQVFGYTENSNLRPALVVLGTGHVYQFSKADASFGLSLGALVTAGANSGASVEYVMGPTVGLLRNLLLLTAGVHIGKRDELQAFEIGKPVPGSASDPLPLQKNWKQGFMFAITYRFK